MQKIIISIFALCMIGDAFATTVNYNWLVDGANYAQTTCETGDDLILPTPSPTKYGYHFVGWRETSIYGSWSQSGTPTPQNPIEPVFKPFLNTVLRAVGSGDNIIADSYNPETRTITRRIGVKVLDGTESWAVATTSVLQADVLSSNAYGQTSICSHLEYTTSSTLSGMPENSFRNGSATYQNRLYVKSSTLATDATTWKQYLADQYAAGTPVTIYYPLNTPVEENLQ